MVGVFIAMNAALKEEEEVIQGDYYFRNGSMIAIMIIVNQNIRVVIQVKQYFLSCSTYDASFTLLNL